MKITKIAGTERVSSGPIQIGEDWPGVFIRGDEALAKADLIVASQDAGWLPHGNLLDDVVKLLRSCRFETNGSG
jgi:hypothetical protein